MTALSTLTTVVVVSYNYARYLREAVESVVCQTTLPQILLIDNASTDDTAHVVQELLSEHPTIVYHGLPGNIGLAKLRNLAARLATTEWILFLDSDDWLDRSYVARAESWFDAHPDVDVLTTDMTIVGRTRRPVRSRVPRFWNDLVARNTIVQSSFIRRRLIERVGGYDPALAYEDWDFWIRVMQAGGRIHRLPGRHVFWRDHHANFTKTCDARAAADAVRKKHMI